MTPSAALSAILTQLRTVSGMSEARSPMGVRNSSSPRVVRSFSVRPGGLSLSNGGGRGRSDQAGIRVSESFDVELGHTLRPSDGQSAPAQALLDLHSVIKVLMKPDTTLTTTAAVSLNSVSTEYPGSGAFYVQTISIDVVYPLSLAV
jgi:hypothetical protein